MPFVSPRMFIVTVCNRLSTVSLVFSAMGLLIYCVPVKKSKIKDRRLFSILDDVLHYTRSPAVARIADRIGCQWPSRSSKVDNFHLIWKGLCDFLLVINSNHGRSLTVFEIRPLIAWNFPLKIAANPLQMEIWLLMTADRKSPAPYPIVQSPTPYDSPFSHNFARLSYHMRYEFWRWSTVSDFHVIWKPIYDFQWSVAT